MHQLPQTCHMKEHINASAKYKTPLKCCRPKEIEYLFPWAILRILKYYHRVRQQLHLFTARLFNLCILAEGHLGLNRETEHWNFDLRWTEELVTSWQLLEKFLVRTLSPEKEVSFLRQAHSALYCHWKLLTNTRKIRVERKVVCPVFLSPSGSPHVEGKYESAGLCLHLGSCKCGGGALWWWRKGHQRGERRGNPGMVRSPE